jgi:hypothetical protein
VAEIANLSSIITALRSDEGYVGVFGDKLSLKPVSKRNGILTQLEETSRRGRAQGQSCEHGIWLFLRQAIDKKEHYDHIVIYSDQQCNHSKLYGTTVSKDDIDKERGGKYIHVTKMIEEYRKKVNPKVNVTAVQVAGYDNSIVPETGYRLNTLAGWTSRETEYIKTVTEVWDDVDKNQHVNTIKSKEKEEVL